MSWILQPHLTRGAIVETSVVGLVLFLLAVLYLSLVAAASFCIWYH